MIRNVNWGAENATRRSGYYDVFPVHRRSTRQGGLPAGDDPTKPALTRVKGEGEAVENDARAEGFADLIRENLSVLSGKIKTVGNAPRPGAATGIAGRGF